MMEKLIQQWSERRVVVGCALRDGFCLALGVERVADLRRIRWALAGDLVGERQAEFAHALRERVYRRPLWAPLTGHSEKEDQVVVAVDTGGPKARMGARERKAALQTQVGLRLLNPGQRYVVTQQEIKDRASGERVLAVAALHRHVAEEYRAWNHQMGIINPHLTLATVGLANLFQVFYPEDAKLKQTGRLLIVEGLDTSRVCYFEGGYLVDTLQFAMFEGQPLTSGLVRQWQNDFMEKLALERAPLPLVLKTGSNPALENAFELWDPFRPGQPGLEWVPEAEAIARQYPDLLPIAFGMALHR